MKEIINILRKEILHHDYLYHIEGLPEISDLEYDKKIKHLESLEAQHPEFLTPDSPTQVVGSNLTEKIE